MWWEWQRLRILWILVEYRRMWLIARELCFWMRGLSRKLGKEELIFVKSVEEAYWTLFVSVHSAVRLAFLSLCPSSPSSSFIIHDKLVTHHSHIITHFFLFIIFLHCHKNFKIFLQFLAIWATLIWIGSDQDGIQMIQLYDVWGIESEIWCGFWFNFGQMVCIACRSEEKWGCKL